MTHKQTVSIGIWLCSIRIHYYCWMQFFKEFLYSKVKSQWFCFFQKRLKQKTPRALLFFYKYIFYFKKYILWKLITMANTQYVGKHFHSFTEMITKTFMVGQIFNRTSQNCRTTTFLGKRIQKQKFCGYLLVKRPGLSFYGGWGGGGVGGSGKSY